MKVACFDIDGTLTRLNEDGSSSNELKEDARSFIAEKQAQDYKIVFSTMRDLQTAQQFISNFFANEDVLICGKNTKLISHFYEANEANEANEGICVFGEETTLDGVVMSEIVVGGNFTVHLFARSDKALASKKPHLLMLLKTLNITEYATTKLTLLDDESFHIHEAKLLLDDLGLCDVEYIEVNSAATRIIDKSSDHVVDDQKPSSKTVPDLSTIRSSLYNRRRAHSESIVASGSAAAEMAAEIGRSRSPSFP